jgi:hypothetical protein
MQPHSRRLLLRHAVNRAVAADEIRFSPLRARFLRTNRYPTGLKFHGGRGGFMRVCLVVALLGILLRGAMAAELHPTPVEPSVESIRTLIDQLGDDDYDRRVEAQQKISEVGVPAGEHLAAALDTDDPEVRLRINTLLPVIVREQALQQERSFLLQRYKNVFGLNKFTRADASELGDPTNHGLLVESALQWLLKNQEDDGRWDSVKHGAQVNADVAHTSLAVMTFLGAGHTLKVGSYKKHVQKGIAWLIKQMRDDGAFLQDGKPVDAIAQALAGVALSECSGMSVLKNDSLEKVCAQKACDFSCSAFRCEDGGFGAAGSNIPDLFTTTLVTMQMYCAKVAGLKVSSADFEHVLHYLESLFDAKENTFKLAAGLMPSGRATYLGCACRMFLNFKRAELAPAVAAAARLYGEPGSEHGDVLGDYFAALVSFHARGEHWKNFHPKLMQSIGQQSRDAEAAGSYPSRGEWSGAGTVFQTALRGLSFEVYYRYATDDPD